MANQILVNPFPFGSDSTQTKQTVEGTIALAGSAVATGEPLDWTQMLTGLAYNEVNFAGNGQNGANLAYVTTLAASGGTITATAANNFSVGQLVTFKGLTTTIGLLLNGQTVTVVTASATQFTFTNAATGSGTGETGLAVPDPSKLFKSLERPRGPAQALTVTALSASGSVLTVTAANKLLPGAQVTISVATGTLGPKLANLTLPVLNSTSTAFTAQMPSALTGTTGTGTGSGINPPVPYSLKVWSALDSGYVYQYNETTGCLFVMAQTNAAAAGDPLAKLGAGAYPAGVLGDVIKYEAKFAKA